VEHKIYSEFSVAHNRAERRQQDACPVFYFPDCFIMFGSIPAQNVDIVLVVEKHEKSDLLPVLYVEKTFVTVKILSEVKT